MNPDERSPSFIFKLTMSYQKIKESVCKFFVTKDILTVRDPAFHVNKGAVTQAIYQIIASDFCYKVI